MPGIKINDTKARLWGIPLLSLAIPLLFFREECVENPSAFFREIVVSFSFTLFLWEGNRRVFSFVNSRYPEYNQTKKRISLLIVSFLSYTLIGYSVVKVLLLTFILKIPFTWEMYFFGLRISILMSFFVSTMYETVYLFLLWKQSVMETESLKKAGLQAELEALKEQVNPHFMFNSLNTLAGLIPENPAAAVTFVERLADTYRYVLNMQKKEVVTLKEELNFLQAFIYVLSARFGEKLRVEINVDETLMGMYLPPVTLQILVENAVKHNIISKDKPLQVTLSTEEFENRHWLKVSNPLQPKDKKEEGSGLGLSNICKRYELLGQAMPRIHESTQSFDVRIALIQVKKYPAAGQ